MTPPCFSFPASELPERVQLDVHGRRRKPAAAPEGSRGGSKDLSSTRKNNPAADGAPAVVDLARCELLSLVQYSCAVDRPEQRNSPVRCWPVQRLFRRCQDRAGPFTVETTAWEGTAATAAAAATGDGKEAEIGAATAMMMDGATPEEGGKKTHRKMHVF